MTEGVKEGQIVYVIKNEPVYDIAFLYDGWYVGKRELSNTALIRISNGAIIESDFYFTSKELALERINDYNKGLAMSRGEKLIKLLDDITELRDRVSSLEKKRTLFEFIKSKLTTK